MLADWHWALLWRGAAAGLILAVPALVALLALRRLRVPAPALWGVLLTAAFGWSMGLPESATMLPAGPVAPVNVLQSWPIQGWTIWAWTGLGLGLLGGAWLPGQPLQAVAAGVALQVVLMRTDAIVALGETGVAMAGLVPVAALAVSACDDRFPGLGPGMLTMSVAGVYLAVPDTELAFPLLGVALGLVALGAPLTRMRIGGIGSAAAVALLFWVAALEAVGRPGSAVGAVGCLGMLAVEPAARLLASNRAGARPPAEASSKPAPGDHRKGSVLWLLGPHAGLVAISSRLVSLADSPVVALSALVPVLAAGVAFSVRQAHAMPEASAAMGAGAPVDQSR